jgi:hypothetical protein
MNLKGTILATFALLLVPFLETVAQENNTEFLPDIDGVLKTKFEYDLNNSLTRFEVRNARFGAKGKVNKYISYRAEIDLSDEGKLKMLDAFVRFTPVKNLDLFMGQRKLPFSTDYIRNPAENLFANRSFVAKYVNDGLRDIGFYADYKFNSGIPLNIIAGFINGTGNNNPQWTKRPNFVSRIVAGGERGLRFAANIYEGEALNRLDLLMTGWELRFTTEKFLIESEFVSRRWNDTSAIKFHDEGFYIHSYYLFPLKGEIFKSVRPVARWDRIGPHILSNNQQADRITFGLTFALDPKLYQAEIRIDYENYFKGYLPAHTDKLTLEFVARF